MPAVQPRPRAYALSIGSSGNTRGGPTSAGGCRISRIASGLIEVGVSCVLRCNPFMLSLMRSAYEGDSPVPLVSNVESMRRGRPSLLATIETFAASGTSLWLAWKYHSVQHIVIASAFVPFLLLRTRLSTRYTIRVLTVVDNTLQRGNFNVIIKYSYIILIPIIKIVCIPPLMS
jgi:hypothetical protein